MKGEILMRNINITSFYSKGYENAELVKVITNEQGQQLVSGRELHEVLKVQKDFTDWIKTQLKSIDALENEDYCKNLFKGELSKTGQTSHDYILTLDIAKEICMCVGVAPRTNEETRQLSKQVRKYFIECEKIANNPYANLSPELQSIIMLDQKQQMLEQQVQTVQQKVNEIELNAKLDAGEYSLVCSKVSSRINAVLKEHGISRNFIGELYKALNRDIKEVTGVKTRTQLRQKHLDTVLELINDWQPSRATIMSINQMSLEI
ncbi:hypothetical protein GMB34_11825 [Turicibacter sanguinis]|jgi:phage anti-repressor protein|nr:hypothetical protein [Turicibacter sanguinis]MTN84882.1 hypothetical protein [Turicibacter sanguinis]MTN87704.1 hypothetical protein [Turicibacter sanguinis]MTN90526.1 hypothetical protein [Turicibacter sanguinis]MTN93448.1 hypothetical protein [Turicibacter sanguinis]